MKKIREMFNQVQINMPLLDANQQVPTYAKFLKDMCTNKRKINVPKKVFLGLNISELLSGTIPVKYKDPGCPTISCIIGQTTINRALLDLRASINLIPFFIYQQLGLGDLRPTRFTIQLADRSVKVPKGKITDVLIPVGEFIYPVDFIVLKTQPMLNSKAQTPVILGQPILATANTIINYRNGSMRLTFDDITKEVNVFLLEKQPRDVDDQSFEVNLIEGLTSEHEEELEYESKHEFNLESDDFNLDQIVDLTVEWATNTTLNIPLQEEKPLTDHIPSSELKALPSLLKYQYFGEKEAFPVIIASHLTKKQEKDLLAVSRENREAISWTMADINGISPSIVQYHIHLIEEVTPKCNLQHRLNPIMQEVVHVENLKLLDNGIIYLISDSRWVSLVHAVPKKPGFTVIENDKKELVQTHL